MFSVVEIWQIVCSGLRGKLISAALPAEGFNYSAHCSHRVYLRSLKVSPKAKWACCHHGSCVIGLMSGTQVLYG